MNIAHQIKSCPPGHRRSAPLRPSRPRTTSWTSAVPQVRADRASSSTCAAAAVAGATCPRPDPSGNRSRSRSSPPSTVPEEQRGSRAVHHRVLVQILQMLRADKEVGKYVVPIVPTSAHLRMEGSSADGHLEPHRADTAQDADQLSSTRRPPRAVPRGGHLRAARMCDGSRRRPSYSTHGTQDDSRYSSSIRCSGSRRRDSAGPPVHALAGLLIGAPPGGTLNGEACNRGRPLALLSSTVPNCVS